MAMMMTILLILCIYLGIGLACAIIERYCLCPSHYWHYLDFLVFGIVVLLWPVFLALVYTEYLSYRRRL